MAKRYDTMTRAELSDLARQRSIKGRSGMTKAELIAALRQG
ncbi:MAG: Ku protein, partial [Deltaproteobacteria bacterium]|nr:Ku protein [Deltaproteobacteria bacterium]